MYKLHLIINDRRAKVNKKTPADMIDGFIHNTRYGPLEIISYTNSKDVRAKFKNTGFESSFYSASIRCRQVKDKLYRSAFNFGYIGVGPHKTKCQSGPTLAYSKWKSMIERCYSGLPRFSNYGDCSVCDEWRNFQVFAEWLYDNYPKDNLIYDLDKDLLISGNRIYSPNACTFLTRAENMAASLDKISAASMREFSVTCPNGEVVNIKNLRQFCIKNGINYKKLHATSTKYAKTHKGWSAQRLI